MVNFWIIRRIAKHPFHPCTDKYVGSENGVCVVLMLTVAFDFALRSLLEEIQRRI